MLKKEGEGWRVIKDLTRDPYCFLIGGDGWATELTEIEWKSLLLLVTDLIQQHKDLESQPMIDEPVMIDAGRGEWWACLSGNKFSWSLKLILQSSQNNTRSVEMFWPTHVAQSITDAMRKM